MTQAPDKEDEQWLSALAGQPDPGADPKLNLQAEALRRVLMAKKELLETQVPVADAARYQQLLFRLRRENLPDSPEHGLVSQEDSLACASPWRGRKRLQSEDDYEDRQVKFPADGESLKTLKPIWRNPTLWGLAATVVLVVGVVFQAGFLHQDQDDAHTLRGGQSTVLIVAEPEVRLAELVAGLRTAGEEPTVKREADGRIVLTVKGTEKVLEYLATQRIEPTLDHGKLTIELRSVKSPK